MECWAELTEPNDTGHIGPLNTDGTIQAGTKFQNMSCMGGVQGVLADVSPTNVVTCQVPLQF